jgi:lipopolysaccharide biosynthesis regulator YciM
VDPAGNAIFFWLGLLGSASILLFAISRGERHAPTPPDHYRTALLQILRNELDAAVESLRLTVQSAEAPADAYIQLGNLLRARGEALAAFRVHQSLTVRQNMQLEERVATFRALAEDYRALGQRSEALNTLESLAQLRRDAPVVADLARESLLLGRYDAAVTLLRELQRLEPGIGRPELAAFLAAAAEHALRRDHRSEARRLLQMAQREDDGCPQALDLLGDLAQLEGDHESALYYWQKLVFAGNAPATDVHEKLEKVYFELGKFSEIERVYAQILEARPRDLPTLLAAARIALKKSESAEAERLLRTTLEVAPRSNAAFVMLVGLWLDEGKSREVRELVASQVAGTSHEQLACPRCSEKRDRQSGYCVACGRFGPYEPAA